MTTIVPMELLERIRHALSVATFNDELSEYASALRAEITALIEDSQDQEIPEGLRTSRPGFPQLWGQAELADYANLVADRLGKPRPMRGRFWSWDRIDGFPEPVARPQGGAVWLARDLAPFIERRLSTDRFRTTPIDENVKAAIRNEHGVLSAAATATKHDVSKETVYRIWRGER